MDTLEKAELTASIGHIAKFLKSGVPICNSKAPDTPSRKASRRRRTQAIAKRFAFQANAKRWDLCDIKTIMFCFENVFIGIEFWLNVLEGLIDGSASIFFVLFLKP